MAGKDSTVPDLGDAAPAGLDISAKEVEAARGDGARQAVKDQAADAYKALTDGALPGAPPIDQYHGSDEIQMYAGNLDLGYDAFAKLVNGKGDYTLPENKIYGLLALERNGRNRTPFVKVMMKHLGLKADELPGGGPSYTNDLTNITDL